MDVYRKIELFNCDSPHSSGSEGFKIVPRCLSSRVWFMQPGARTYLIIFDFTIYD